MKTLLVTGGAGLLGQALLPRLSGEWHLRSLSRQPAPGYPETVEGSIEDADTVARAMQGVDAVLHLACRYANDISFEQTLDTNYRGTLLLMEAARSRGVGHVVFASSNHVHGFHPRSHAPLSDEASPRPDGWYAISKIWGEAVMAHYADAFGMITTSLRIGSCCPQVTDERQGHMWLGFDDCAQLVRIALARRDAGHRVWQAVSDCPQPFFDAVGAKAAGYVPAERPEDNEARPGVMAEAPTGGIFGRAIGGGFAVANFKADLDRWEQGA